MNIPIYRAKKLDSDEWVEGYLLPPEYNSQSISTDWTKNFYDDFVPNEYEIDPNTLAIHFPNMIDKNGKKIFASLSEDGVGGDIIDTTIGTRQDFISICTKNGICVLTSDTSAIKNTPINTILNHNHRGLKVIGIYKGE